ncbi:hypothetical protein AMELA_G00096080 [Ameiurus melas]|uniref:Uncharacterized protein n=1 Tax=Ameiurus melas TaxID=219545 RepID=A0A7J6AVE4_AMEME|nr:hypothetical protein AMELA_G00096080 [Ameiurus melas]
MNSHVLMLQILLKEQGVISKDKHCMQIMDGNVRRKPRRCKGTCASVQRAEDIHAWEPIINLMHADISRTINSQHAVASQVRWVMNTVGLQQM